MDKMLIKQSRNKNPSDNFLNSLQFNKYSYTIKSDFGEQFHKHLKELIIEFADITEEPEELPPHRGMLDHKMKLNCYSPTQGGNRFFVPEYEELKRQCIELLHQGEIRVLTSPYATPIVMVRKPDGSVRVCIDYRAINEHTVRDSYPLPRIDDLIE
jgi:hypothetical protein